MNQLPNSQKGNRHPKIAKRLAIALLLSLAARFLLASLARDGYAWQAHDVAMHFNSCLLIAVIGTALWNCDKYSKYLACGWLGFEIMSLMEAFFTLFQMPNIDNLSMWQVLATAVFCALAYVKASNKKVSEP